MCIVEGLGWFTAISFGKIGLFFWFSHEQGSYRLHVADSTISWAKPSASAQGT